TLLRAPVVVPGGIYERVEHGVVVDLVVVRAGDRLDVQLVAAEEVASPDLDRVDTDAARDGVEGLLQHRGRLGAARPAVRTRRCAVGYDAAGPEAHRWHTVRAAQHHLRLAGLDRVGLGICPRVAELIDV